MGCGLAVSFFRRDGGKRAGMMRRLAVEGAALPLAIIRKPQDELIGWIVLVRDCFDARLWHARKRRGPSLLAGAQPERDLRLLRDRPASVLMIGDGDERVVILAVALVH